MADRERDRPHSDDAATERVGDRDGHGDGDSGEESGPYGNPSLDEEALRKSQEERSPKRGGGGEPGS
jgi:hypothetical protein